MHRCQQFLFPFARCLNKSGHYQPSVFVAEATVTQMNITGKKSPRKRFIFVKDWHMFIKIIQDSFSKHFASVTECYQSCYCTDKAQRCAGDNFMRMPTLACARRAIQKTYFLKPEVHAEPEWCAGLGSDGFLPSATLWVGCGASGTQQDEMSPSSSLSTALYFNKAHPRQY